MPDPEQQLPICDFQVPFLRCFREPGHPGMHRTEGGTEFSNSGKVGLGEIGVDYRTPVDPEHGLQDGPEVDNPTSQEHAP